MIKQPFLISMVLTLLLSGCSKDPTEAVEKSKGETRAKYSVLDEDLSQLVTDFNAQQGKVRQIFIVGPTCGICLRGMADLNDEYIQAMQNEPRLHTFVVHVPTFGAEEKDVSATIPLLSGPRVSHYWDESGNSGRDFREVLGIDLYAWDVWLLFDPAVTWDPGSLPPAPDFWQHQLGPLPKSQILDKVVFAQEVKRRISQLAVITKDSIAANAAEKSAAEMIPVVQPGAVMMEQHIIRRGGYRQLKTIASVKFTGYSESRGKQYPLSIAIFRPNTFIRSIERDGHSVTAKWDGKAASYKQESSMLIPKNIMDEILRGFDFDGWIVEWKDKGYKIRRLGMKKMADKLPWVMEAELPNGQTWQMYIDSHSGDQFRTALIDKNNKEIFVIEFDNFLVVDGFRMPHRVRYMKEGKLIATDNYSSIHITRTVNETEDEITH